MGVTQIMSDYGVTVSTFAASALALVKWGVPWAIRKEFTDPMKEAKSKALANTALLKDHSRQIEMMVKEIDDTKASLDDLGTKMDSLVNSNYAIKESLAVQSENNKRIIDHYQAAIEQVKGFTSLIESDRNRAADCMQGERRAMEKAFQDNTTQLREQSQMLANIVQKVVDKLSGR